ncbi:DUF4097 family beta strand repeat-containing protein, partial [Natronoarchaeum mannanilyticum]
QQTEETHTFDVADLDELTLRNGVGDVSVAAEDRSDVRVRAVTRAANEDHFDSISLVEQRSGGTLALSVDNEIDSVLLGSPPSMDLDVAVPSDLRVADVKTDTGDVEIEGTSGALNLETDTGDGVVRSVEGAVDATTETGDLTIRSSTSVSGVETETGDAEIDVAALDGDARLETETGDVDAALAASLDARVVVRTETGDVTSGGLDFSDLESGEHRLEGTLGEGSNELTIETETGDVTLSGL